MAAFAIQTQILSLVTSAKSKAFIFRSGVDIYMPRRAFDIIYLFNFSFDLSKGNRHNNIPHGILLYEKFAFQYTSDNKKIDSFLLK